MLSTIKSFSVGYNPINQNNIFTSGDCIAGQITLELAKECEIYSLCVKLKGKAEVSWVEPDGKKSKTYHAKEKYFSIKQVIIEESKGRWTTDDWGNLLQHDMEPAALRLKDAQEVKGGQMFFVPLWPTHTYSEHRLKQEACSYFFSQTLMEALLRHFIVFQAVSIARAAMSTRSPFRSLHSESRFFKKKYLCL